MRIYTFVCMNICMYVYMVMDFDELRVCYFMTMLSDHLEFVTR